MRLARLPETVLPLLPFPLLHAIADAGLVEDVGGVVGVVAQLAAELLGGGAHPPGVAGAPAGPRPFAAAGRRSSRGRRWPIARRAARTRWRSAARDARPASRGARRSRWSALQTRRVPTARPIRALPACSWPAPSSILADGAAPGSSRPNVSGREDRILCPPCSSALPRGRRPRGSCPWAASGSCVRSSRPFRTWPSSPSLHGLETTANVPVRTCGNRPFAVVLLDALFQVAQPRVEASCERLRVGNPVPDVGKQTLAPGQDQCDESHDRDEQDGPNQPSTRWIVAPVSPIITIASVSSSSFTMWVPLPAATDNADERCYILPLVRSSEYAMLAPPRSTRYS